MKLHEFQAKQLLRAYGIAVPAGKTASSADQARAIAQELGGDPWVVKAQVHAGARGKAGGVKQARDADAVAAEAERLLGKRLVTAQSGGRGQPVNTVLVEQTADVTAELYLGLTLDRSRERIVMIASRMGGMAVEEAAETDARQILTVAADPVVGLQAFHCRQLAFGLGLTDKQVGDFTRLALALYRLYTDQDLNLVEINPLAITGDATLLALDAKITVDGNALYRHADLEALRDETQEDEKEARARRHDLNYVTLDGDIACMVNGAGLAMATMDLIKLHGGEPANFLDVGGGTSADKVAEAFRLILADEKVQAILVNIFGGIVRCDLIAEGIIQAAREVGIKVPLVVRLEGTRAEEGRRLLQSSGFKLITAETLTEAARKVVDAARGRT